MDRKRFTVLKGGKARQPQINSVSLRLVLETLSPLPVDVRVFEEDTFLVLTVDPVIRLPEEHPVRLMTDILSARPKKPGSVLTRNNSWYAVVHDLDADQTCRREWVEKAYRTILRLAEHKRVRRVAIPLLGSVHGKFPPDDSLDLLINVLTSLSFQSLRTLLILAPKAAQQGLASRLRKLAGN